MTEFFPIETPYSSKEYEMMNTVVNQGIDSNLEGFTKSEFKKSPHWANKFLWNIHQSELPVLLRRFQEKYEETSDDDYFTFMEEIKSLFEDTQESFPEEEVAEVVDPNYSSNISEPIAQTTPLPAQDSEINEEEIREMIRRQLQSFEEGDNMTLTNQNGENLKPQNMRESYGDRYDNIVFLQGEQADETMEILNNDGVDAAMEHLKQWHYPGEHDGNKELGHGTMDKTYKKDGYIMAWNPYLPYIGLQYDNDYNSGNNQELDEDSLVMRHRADQRQKTTPLGPHSQAAK